jgi:hypothetical protein
VISEEEVEKTASATLAVCRARASASSIASDVETGHGFGVRLDNTKLTESSPAWGIAFD